MAYSQVHFSNSLEELAEVFKENLYPNGATPFAKRLVIVPDLGLKDYLMQRLAQDPRIQIAAGLEITHLADAIAKVTKKKIPSTLELSLFLQHELLPLIDSEPDLRNYFQNKGKRIGPFCDQLAENFLRYVIFGKPHLENWQESLWKKWNFRFPQKSETNWQVHIFGFSFIPELYLSYFEKWKAKMYLFSPCQIFWGDFYEEDLFEDQNPFLTSLGLLGRKCQLMIEEGHIPTEEHYVPPASETTLASIQRDLLTGSKEEYVSDESISFSSAMSMQKEIEGLKEQIIDLLRSVEPKDVLVLAPQIGPYAPFIEVVFSDLDYAINDMPRLEYDSTARGFWQLIQLPKERFPRDEVMQLLAKLTKFPIDLALAKKWLEKGGVRWGFSKKEREGYYLKDFDPDQITSNSEIGTWDYGFKKLLLEIYMSPVEMGAFNQLYELIHSLTDDLAPFSDGTKWTIPTWFRYFACLLETYFEIDPSYDLYKELMQLASSSDHLDKQEFPFDGVERILRHLLQKKSKSVRKAHNQTIQFSSLTEGAIVESSAIFLIGMQEEAFPGREKLSSLYKGELHFRPTKTMQDRYLFLQTLSMAKSRLHLSYVRDPEGKLGESALIQELLEAIEGVKIDHLTENVPIELKKKEPLIPEFYERKELVLSPLMPMEIDCKKLLKFAKHPLRYYLHEELGIYPDFSGPDQREYLLDPLEKYHLVQEALEKPLSEVFEEAKAQMPVSLLESLAKNQVAKEVEEWQNACAAFDISPETKRIEKSVGPIQIVGTIDGVSSKGILVRGKNCIEDQVRFWPLGLLLNLPILFTKDHGVFEAEGSFEDYLSYYQLAKKHPSPLIPSLAKPFLLGSDLNKALKQIGDEAVSYLLLRDPMPSASVLVDNWEPIFTTVFGGVYAQV